MSIASWIAGHQYLHIFRVFFSAGNFTCNLTAWPELLFLPHAIASAFDISPLCFLWDVKCSIHKSFDLNIQVKLKGTVSRLCARASVICFFFKRQWNCHIDSTRFPSGPHRRRRFVVIFSSNILDFRRSLSSYINIWLAVRRLIAILSLAGPPRDPKISFRSL